MQNIDDGIRKAAILALSLDQQASDRLLERMDPQQTHLVRQAMVELESIDPQEKRRVIDEFFRGGAVAPAGDPPEVEPHVEQPVAQPEPRQSPPKAVQSQEEEEPHAGPSFRFLREAKAEKLASILAGERAQTVAVVLSHLPPEQAGTLLATLEPAIQAEVIRRLVDLEEMDPDVLRDVERGLQQRLSEQVQMQQRRMAGLSAVSGILDASSRDVGTAILGNLASRERQLAEKLSPRRPTFEQMGELDDLALATLMRAAGAELTVLALVGAPPRLAERFLRSVPESESKPIRQQLTHLGPTRLSDVEEARREIAELAWRLALAGRISLPDGTDAPVYGPQRLSAAA